MDIQKSRHSARTEGGEKPPKLSFMKNGAVWKIKLFYLIFKRLLVTFKRAYQNMQDEQFLLSRLPLPHVWLINPAIFAFGWFIAAMYLSLRLTIFEGDPFVINPLISIWFVRMITLLVVLPFTVGTILLHLKRYIIWSENIELEP
ncbi:hypothetical protein ACFLX5_05920 [Chloroflexota bacterium]